MTSAEFGNPEYLYVRPCYRDLYQILHETWQGEKPRVKDPQHCALITGTPGIGKSICANIIEGGKTENMSVAYLAALVSTQLRIP